MGFARAFVLALKVRVRARRVHRDYADPSIVVARPKGLVTHVLRNTETVGFLDIEKRIGELD